MGRERGMEGGGKEGRRVGERGRVGEEGRMEKGGREEWMEG